jgi:hypothetical protein
MMRLDYYDWIFDCDVEATRRAYATIPKGSAEECTCPDCRNYNLTRQNVFPEEIQQFFTCLGIDRNRECEIWQYNREPSGLHFYGGMFFFIGYIVQEGTMMHTDEKFSITFKEGYTGPRVTQTKLHPSVGVYFNVLLPWELEKEDEPN